MNLRQIYLVGRREYIARVRNKAFLFTTLLVPILLAAYILVLPLLFTQTGPSALELALLDVGTGLSGEVQERLEQIETPQVTVRDRVSVDLSQLEALRGDWSRRVRDQELDGYLVLQPGEETPARATYYARETGNPILLSQLEDAVETTQLERILTGSGVDLGQVRRIQRSDLTAVRVSDKGEEEGGFQIAFFSTLTFGMLLYMAVLINGQGMAMAIVEEKSSKLIEVILGAVTALEFMVGKILGVLLSGLTQLGIWILCALLAGLYALPALAVGFDGSLQLSSILQLELLFYFSIFFALGYLLYSTLFAAVAATCSSTEELGQAMFPAMFPFIVAFFITFYAVPNPSTLATRLLSLFPLFTPLVMMARVNVLMPPLWEIWLSILLLIAGVGLSFWLCSKVFRFALLMHGKRPSLREIVRMIRVA